MTGSTFTTAPRAPLRAWQSLAVLMVLLASALSADYCTICSDHTMCKYSGVSSTCTQGPTASGTSSADQSVIVDTHNSLRNQVASGSVTRGNPGPQPSAANMQRLSWDAELATIAQRWVDQCIFQHDSCRNVDRYYVGQNLALTGSSPCTSTSDKTPNWDFAIEMWFKEVDSMDKGNVGKFSSGGPTVGHYTQVVWGTTTKVGCGYRMYQDGTWCRKYYACNYGKGGNLIGSPVYKAGSPRTQCDSQGSVDSKYPALC